MKLLAKYILKNLIKRFLLTTFLFLFLGILTRIVHYLDIITQNQGSIFDLLSILFLIQIKIIVVLSPFSLLIATFLVYDSLIKSNEHIASYNVGVSKVTLLSPLIYFSSFLFFINLFLSSVLVPLSYSKMEEIHNKILTQVSNSIIRPGEFINQNGILMFIHEVNQNKLANGIVLIDKREKEKQTIIVLEQGKIAIDEKHIFFDAQNAYMSRYSDYSTYPLISNFKTFKIAFSIKSYLPSARDMQNVISNKELLEGVLSNNQSNIKEFKTRFGWAFFTILIPLSVATCLLNFFNFSRSRVKISHIITSICIVGYTIFSSLLGEVLLPHSIFGLFLYYINICLIFIFLLFNLQVKTFS